jgi:hypothetical protein
VFCVGRIGASLMRNVRRQHSPRMPAFSHRFILAAMSLIVGSRYGQVAVENALALSAGRNVTSKAFFVVELSGWSFVALSASLALVSAVAAIATWCIWRSAWVLTATLWACVLITSAMDILAAAPDVRRTIYFFVGIYIGTMLTLGVRRMVNEKHKSVVPAA